ncbi:hypothetical protein [uncultured Pseudokineococcus sp.]|uniref:hypothetical protein n=1 Tax=uncultured Pseudokineococcus sp. TaxID=1642928 RepID=UPI0026130A2F|nr:hypothetical protein [uncultured Pseudokineococcus sp.]
MSSRGSADPLHLPGLQQEPRRGPQHGGRPARPVAPDLLRAAWGATCLLAPDAVQRAMSGHDPDVRGRRVLRVLGARHLVQAAGGRVLPPRLAVGGGAAVDGIHSATALALGLLDVRRRRAALVDAVVAGAWCAWGAARYRRAFSG